MLHRFDLHVHSYFSADAASAPEELIEAARARGLSGIAITDHDTCEAHEYLIEKGLEQLDGQPAHGFLVIPGVEVSTADGHLLCIGTILPMMRGEPAAKVVKTIEDRGGVAIPAHPYDRWRAGIREEILDSLDLKAIEVFNAAAKKEYNEQALAYATRRGLSMTASSDAHHASAVAVSFDDLRFGRSECGGPGWCSPPRRHSRGSLSFNARDREKAIRNLVPPC